MTSVTASKGSFSLRAYRGDTKTLLAFNLVDKKSAKNLAGFTILCQPKGQPPYYILNELRFETPGKHAQDPKESPNSSINAPIHKFRWVHVPGSAHQGIAPFLGEYTYTVTPRYFDGNNVLQPLDVTLSVSAAITVDSFEKNGVALGFTRGYTQSQAFVHHFGLDALIEPKNAPLIFDTTQQSGSNAAGEHFTFQDQYDWLGFTARSKIFALLNEVVQNTNLRADVFAYDLNEPDVMKILLALAKQGRVRIILDNAALHHSTSKQVPEDAFEKLFVQAAGSKTLMKRGHFKRYAHDKVVILRNAKTGAATKVLTGSTNFSVTGLYVNSNHILVFSDPKVASTYAAVFDEAWSDGVNGPTFAKSALATKAASFTSQLTPPTIINFSPHNAAYAQALLNAIAKRIAQEGKKGKAIGSVLFAVMQIDNGKSPVYDALNALHKRQDIFSYGISDSPSGIALHTLGKKTGVLVTGKPVQTQLPPPFSQVRNIGGVGHQVHHKFVVCGFNTPDAVVYCGSSNLAEGGEESNGDNLLAVNDQDVATVFAIEALVLVDHFEFLDRCARGGKPSGKAAAPKNPPALKRQAAVSAGWFLSTDDGWTAKYFDPKDLYCMDRLLFA